MTLDEIKAKLDAKAATDIETKNAKIREKTEEYNKQVARLKEIQPRIQKILDIYVYAKEIGISSFFDKRRVSHDWGFLADGIYNKPGIMYDNCYMGIYTGDDYGVLNFYVNGEEFFFRHEKYKNFYASENHSGIIKDFCDKFEQYELCFYNSIEHIMD